jgi:DNA-binding response OmpR family regulator
LPKPFSPETLGHRVREVLDRPAEPCSKMKKRAAL